MQTKFLFSNKYKRIGWWFLSIGLILGLYVLITDVEPPQLDWNVPALFYSIAASNEFKDWQFLQIVENNLLNESAGLSLLIGSLLLVFSREKDEDEFTMKLRLESLLWSTMIYGIILGLALLFLYDVLFFQFMMVNMFLLFLLFIGKFHWVMYNYRKLSNEK